MEKPNVNFTMELPSDDPELNGLAICIAGMDMTSERMRKATLEYLLDRYVINADKDND